MTGPSRNPAVESVVMKALAKDREALHSHSHRLCARPSTIRMVSPPNTIRLCVQRLRFHHRTDCDLSRLRHDGLIDGDDSEATGDPAAPQSGRRPEIDFLGFALADSVITQLAPLKSLIVRPSSAVEKYRNQVVEPRAIGRELQVDTILSGSYLKAADIFRVNVQLVDVSRNEILWQERIDLKFDNVIALQDKICEVDSRLAAQCHDRRAGGDQTRRGLQPDGLRVLPARPRVRRHAQRSPAGDRDARSFCRTRLVIRPGLGRAGGPLHQRPRHPARRNYARQGGGGGAQGLEINPQLPSAFFWLAVYYGEKGDLKNALVICKQLLQAAPNSEYAYQAMGHAYDYAGLPEIALTLFRKAAEINPVAYPHMLGFLQYQKGDYAGARRELEACSDSIPKNISGWRLLTSAKAKTKTPCAGSRRWSLAGARNGSIHRRAP